jgi:hypothetical protein
MVELAELQSRPTLLGACTSCPSFHEKIVQLHSRIVSLEADLKVPIPTSCSTCELHAMKNFDLAKCVGRLQDENDKLREALSWLSSQEPQLGMMIASCKHFDGWALGLDKVDEGSGERERKFGNVSVPPQPTPKDKFASKPNQPREKPSEKASEKPSEKPSEQPYEEPHPKPKPRSIRFHCEFCGKDGHKRAFCFKRKREERMTKESANKDKYQPSDGVLEPRMQLPRAKPSVRTVRAWGERKAVGGVAAQATPVRPVRGTVQTGAGLDRQQFGFRASTNGKFGSGGRGSGGWSGKFAGGQFARHSPPCAQYGDGRIRSFEKERRDSPRVFVRGFGPPPGREVWLPYGAYHGGVRGSSFGRKDGLVCANPTIEQMARHWFYTFGTNPMLSRFLSLALGFVFQVDGPENIWLISGVVLWPHIPVVTCRCITFGDGGQG